MSGFTTGNYAYYYALSGDPSEGLDNINEQSNGPTSLTFTDNPVIAGDGFTWTDGPETTGFYTGYTYNGDPIVVVLGGAYYLVSDAVYSDPSSFTAQSTPDFTCYCAGTLILTERGEIAVEDLAIGDVVFTADGGRQPIRWTGHRKIRTHGGRYLFADPLLVSPIRIRAGALAEKLPRRDLCVSPEHAILIGDILVQAGALVNDVSIVREDRLPDVLTYYHIELAAHALVLAEGVAAESFVDDVNRLSFDNRAEHEALVGGPPPIVEMPYPRAQSYRQVPPAIHAALMDRARVLMGDIAA